MEGLVQCSANYVPLSPISFLERAAMVYGGKTSIIYGMISFSWRETHERCLKLASALSQLGIHRGDIVAALAPNIPALYELHFGVPMAGAVLSAVNTRLDSSTLTLLLRELEAKIIFVDSHFLDLVLEALNNLSLTGSKLPLLVLVPKDPNYHQTTSSLKEPPPNSLDYNELLSMGKTDFKSIYPINECDPISVNYTSGSTGKPKGVVYSHRAAYLNSLAEIFRSEMRPMPTFLWTVDMFRCNGWCFTWAVAALGGTNICVRDVSAKVIFDAIVCHGVTHLCGAPTILGTIADTLQNPQWQESHALGLSFASQRQLPRKVQIIVAGALPPAQVLHKVEELGFNVTHAYGMTEALGPVTTKPWHLDHNTSHSNESAKLKCLEGMHNLMMEGVDVKDPITTKSVPRDGKTIGQVMFRGNAMMSGYIKNFQATQEAFRGGWYRTGDLGVIHPDGYIEMKDRAIDTIIYGGQTISTLEIEAVLSNHPMVWEAAVVGRPDDQYGELPCAFVKLKEGSNVSSEEIIKFCGDHLPCHMTPLTVFFGDLPFNSTGKIQKFVLREKAKAMGNVSL